MEVVGPDGSILAVAAGGRCISDGCPDCIYNLNPSVVGFGPDTGAVGICPEARDCKAIADENPGGEGLVYIDPSIWTDSDPVVQCNPQCTFVFPPLKLGSPTTITLPEYPTSLVQSYLTTRTTTLEDGKSDTELTLFFHVKEKVSLATQWLPVTNIPVTIRKMRKKVMLTWWTCRIDVENSGYSMISESTTITFPPGRCIVFEQ